MIGAWASLPASMRSTLKFCSRFALRRTRMSALRIFIFQSSPTDKKKERFLVLRSLLRPHPNPLPVGEGTLGTQASRPASTPEACVPNSAHRAPFSNVLK